MSKKDIIKKLTSRKFIVAAITLVSGIVTVIVGHEEAVTTIAGALMSIIPAIVYCVTEGRVDAAAVKAVTDTVSEVVQKLEHDEKSNESTDIKEVKKTE